MYKQLLVATDGSAHGYRAVKAACELAAACGARLSVVHVMGEGEVPEVLAHLVEAEHLVEPLQFEVRNVADVGSAMAAARSAGESAAHRYRMWAAIGDRVVREAVHEARQRGVEVGITRQAEGDPVQQIMLAAADSGADMLVLGRRGVSDLKGLLMGSVSHKICQLADCAVLTVK